MVDVAIIGAGPYGLSIAAHLKARGVDFRILGSPMHTWLTQMPQGMRLKSEGFASTLYDPASSFTLAHYCREKGLPYADTGLPVPLETFASYGLEFQKRLVPELEEKLVVSVERFSSGFRIGLEDNGTVAARNIVVAVGISHFQHLPPALSALPEEVVTHTSRHRTFDRFKGREVTVIGGGASALDVAALLHQAGASVQLVARKPKIHFHHPPGRIPRPLLERVQYPMTGIGPGWRSLLCVKAPQVFHLMPEAFRLEVVRRHLGPAAAWFVKDQVVGHVGFNLGLSVTQAAIRNGRVQLQLTDGKGGRQTLLVDHVIAGTGYKVDLQRLAFLDPATRAEIQSVNHTPVLSANFESSIPGLYFVGASSANSFGPLVRFAYGAEYTARRLAKHLARSARRSVPGVAIRASTAA
jgi:thioredoxin reductase